MDDLNLIEIDDLHISEANVVEFIVEIRNEINDLIKGI